MKQLTEGHKSSLRIVVQSAIDKNEEGQIVAEEEEEGEKRLAAKLIHITLTLLEGVGKKLEGEKMGEIVNAGEVEDRKNREDEVQ